MDAVVMFAQRNDSAKHAVPEGSETHFSVTIVSPMFEGVKLIERHRLVQNLLSEELKCNVHALSITAKAPSQWTESPVLNTTPACAGGDGTFADKV